MEILFIVVMGCCFSKRKMEIEIIDTISKDPEFDYLRPKGRLILKMDCVYDVSNIDIIFNDWYSNSVRFWPKTDKAHNHFYCHCKEEHVYYVHTCSCHPLVHRRMQGMDKKCSCKVLGPYEVYNFFVQVKYLINFCTYKICMKKIPKNVQRI